MGTIASQITSLTSVYSASRVFTQVQIKEIIKAPRHWPLCGKFTGDRSVPRTNDQWRGKCFHLMTSSWTHQAMTSRHRMTCHPRLPIKCRCQAVAEHQWRMINITYRKVSNIRRTKPQHLNVSRLILWLSFPNPLKAGVKSRMKM